MYAYRPEIPGDQERAARENRELNVRISRVYPNSCTSGSATAWIGFHGYLTKDAPVSRFASSLRAVVEGQVVFPRRLASAIARPSGEDGLELLSSHLTAREREVLGLMAEGLGGTDVARRLGITTNTVRTHIQGILTKLQVHSRLEAVAFAHRRGIIRLPQRGESDTA